MNRIKYPVGIQTFSKIIEGNYLYVDKTDLVYKLIDDYQYVFLSHPRRFGKTLLTSTIEAYFKGQKELFDGLAIAKLEREWIEYPVIRIDLSSVYFRTKDELQRKLDDILREFESALGIDKPLNLLSSRFSNIIRRLRSDSGREVVILIDEYDKPILDTLGDNVHHDEIRNELRAFYAAIKENDRYIRFVMLTGIWRFSKVSIFSGFNNLEDISLNPEFNAICGITETEMEEYFEESMARFAEINGQTKEEIKDSFRENYDGYHFARSGEDIYNPFSVLKACKNRFFDNYRFDSVNPDFLIRLIKQNSYKLNGIENSQRSGQDLGDISMMNHDLVPILFQTGYLTIKEYNPQTELYTLNFPNREVKKSFWTTLANHIFVAEKTVDVFSTGNIIKALRLGDAEQAMVILQSLFADMPPGTETNKEVHFQNMTAIAFKMIGLETRTEVSSSKGRCDMEVFTDSFIYIIEFKVNSSPEEAISQIRERGYVRRHNADPRRKILIGADFSTVEGTLSRWVIETL